ncbi:MAG: urate hydroxylase PuuD [Gammaproteobacteria bacterium]|nr:urate hydroxylase PuuD [Gammaproteobacteria bacterium]NND40244.1 antitermination protein NusG [Pseudomonadales bacterium]MBT8151402.1 urate hydroxylase PuuD [Gammaproteobacteria bacterium]NNL11981.1 antitermination protein NusG [Pseudomonadales bacterium]NNM10843.1 antitermination protein NusG [Pseudomonadales bacterium]
MLIEFIFRWAHVLFGITWIGLLYYFNFIQGGYFKAASPEGLADAKAKLAPEALWWFRWGAMFTFLTGLVLLHFVYGKGVLNEYIVLGALMGTFMFLNVWLIIWPNQKIALGMVDGDGSVAGPKALLASRTNTLFSAPMAFGMLAGPHFIEGYGAANWGSAGFLIALALVVLLEVNAIMGKLGPMESVKGVIHSSLGLTAIVFAAVYYL